MEFSANLESFPVLPFFLAFTDMMARPPLTVEFLDFSEVVVPMVDIAEEEVWAPKPAIVAEILFSFSAVLHSTPAAASAARAAVAAALWAASIVGPTPWDTYR